MLRWVFLAVLFGACASNGQEEKKVEPQTLSRGGKSVKDLCGTYLFVLFFKMFGLSGSVAVRQCEVSKLLFA